MPERIFLQVPLDTGTMNGDRQITRLVAAVVGFFAGTEKLNNGYRRDRVAAALNFLTGEGA